MSSMTMAMRPMDCMFWAVGAGSATPKASPWVGLPMTETTQPPPSARARAASGAHLARAGPRASRNRSGVPVKDDAQILVMVLLVVVALELDAGDGQRVRVVAREQQGLHQGVVDLAHDALQGHAQGLLEALVAVLGRGVVRRSVLRGERPAGPGARAAPWARAPGPRSPGAGPGPPCAPATWARASVTASRAGPHRPPPPGRRCSRFGSRPAGRSAWCVLLPRASCLGGPTWRRP